MIDFLSSSPAKILNVNHLLSMPYKINYFTISVEQFSLTVMQMVLISTAVLDSLSFI